MPICPLSVLYLLVDDSDLNTGVGGAERGRKKFIRRLFFFFIF